MVERLIEDASSRVGHAGNAEHANAAVARCNHFRNRGHSDQICPDLAKVAYFRRRLVVRPGKRRVHAFVHSYAHAFSFPECHFTKLSVVRRSHVRKARAESFLIGARKRIDALQINVIADRHQPPLHEFLLDATRGVRQNDGLHAHAREDADGKRHLLHGITLVKMDAPLHPGHRDRPHFSDDQLAGMTDRGRLRKVRNFRVRNFRRAREFVRKSAQTRAKNQCNLRPESRFGKNKLGGAPRAFEFLGSSACSRHRGRCAIRTSAASCSPLALRFWTHVNIPTMEADIKLAIVPASMARMPNFASWPRCSGASAPMPPICMPMELKLAKPQSANVAIVKVRGSSVLLIAPSCWNATSSLITMRVPRRFPMAPHSFHGMPITHATGAKSQPKICWRLDGNHAR